MTAAERIDELFDRGWNEDWRFPSHISREEWSNMSGSERLRLSHKAFMKRRDAIFARVRAQYPDGPEEQIVYEALLELYDGDIDPDFMRGAAAAIAQRAAALGERALSVRDGHP